MTDGRGAAERRDPTERWGATERRTPENAHTTNPSPDRLYTFVGTESLAPPTNTALSSYHGGLPLFYTPSVTRKPHQLSSIAPLAGKVDGCCYENPRSKKARADPLYPERSALVRAPGKPQDAVRTAHDFSTTHDEVCTN